MNDISELPEHFFKEIRNFFEDYKKLENKSVDVEKFHGADVAKQVILQAIEDYNQIILPNL